MQAEFERYQVSCILRKPEESKVEIPILTVLHRPMGKPQEEVMGEYYFFPVFGRGKRRLLFYDYADDIGGTDRIYTVFSAVSSIFNFYLPFGVFVLNRQIKEKKR